MCSKSNNHFECLCSNSVSSVAGYFHVPHCFLWKTPVLEIKRNDHSVTPLFSNYSVITIFGEFFVWFKLTVFFFLNATMFSICSTNFSLCMKCFFFLNGPFQQSLRIVHGLLNGHRKHITIGSRCEKFFLYFSLYLYSNEIELTSNCNHFYKIILRNIRNVYSFSNDVPNRYTSLKQLNI